MKTLKISRVAAFAFVASLVSGPAFAEGKKEWQEGHPRRAEVNERLKNQNERVAEGVKDGTMTKDEAKEIHKEDRKIRRQERRDASRHGGHITKGEQRRLNREENKVSKQINADKQPAPAPAPVPAQ